ncbi:methyltransferase [Carboxydothermus islandicus]|uniref:Methyltransferase n=1 Tax=Carboxydothermus islandicus TaxID=661089 RepID=A0A1L8D072_9THEO|nr:MgtC/SapB family protein [Carboxydothermus islandicus]GAV24544.1 methyltransferase [Carboxydothermus islandicus]
MSELEIVIRLILASILGGLIGLERESIGKSAGFRTHILVCVGSALIMLLSEQIYFDFYGKATADPARLAAQVVSGIGFLGAGTILREGLTIRGLTTAASLWVVSGVGLAVGMGFYFGAVVATGIVYIALLYLGKVERYLEIYRSGETVTVLVEDTPGQLAKVSEAFGRNGINIDNVEIIKKKNQQVQIVIMLSRPDKNRVYKAIEEIANLPGVIQVQKE